MTHWAPLLWVLKWMGFLLLFSFGFSRILRKYPSATEKMLSPHCPRAIELLKPELDLLSSRKDQAASGLHILAIIALAAYFRPEDRVSGEDLLVVEKQIEQECPTFTKKLVEARSNLLSSGRAAARVNIFYAFPILVFVAIHSCLDCLSPLLLRHSKRLQALWTYYFSSVLKDLVHPRKVREVAMDFRPLVLTWICLLPPVGITMMVAHFLRKLIGHQESEKNVQSLSSDCLCLPQMQKRSSTIKSVSFFNSPCFNIVAFLPFLLGIPGAICLWLYWQLGIDPLLGYPSHCFEFKKVFLQIDMYLYPLGWCLSALFFRSYFTFFWDFTSSEYDVEIYPDLISTTPIKGWFLDFLTLRLLHMPTRLLWKDVISVKYSSARLPALKRVDDNPLLDWMSKVSSIWESLADRMNIQAEFLEIETSSKRISIRLWELTPQQKLELFCRIREYAPSIHMDDRVQKALVGSTILKEAKYTEIWFSILMSKEEDRSGDLAAGQPLQQGRYIVKSVLATGGQAVVYRAEKSDGQPVVLKEFQLTGGESLDAKIESARPFESESSMLSRLQHPSLVKMLEFFYENGRVYLVLEQVQGRNLRELVAGSGTPPLAVVVNLARQMSEILRYLHEQTPAVVHRDFTPENMIIQPDGQLKLIDFSVAELTGEHSSSECAGKHAYTPPEQFRGEACPASDIYALGGVIYFLVTGRDPRPITMSDLSSYAVPESLARIVRTATNLDLSQRYESIDWLLTDLRALEEEMHAQKNAHGDGFDAWQSGAKSSGRQGDISEKAVPLLESEAGTQRLDGADEYSCGEQREIEAVIELGEKTDAEPEVVKMLRQE